jgi:hypothetical protein
MERLSKEGCAGERGVVMQEWMLRRVRLGESDPAWCLASSAGGEWQKGLGDDPFRFTSFFRYVQEGMFMRPKTFYSQISCFTRGMHITAKIDACSQF